MQGTPIAMDPHRPIASGAMPQSEHERLKMRWDKRWGPPDRLLRHDKTAVLQLSWDQPHDDLNVGPEVGTRVCLSQKENPTDAYHS
jgi:hypothetical protein